MSKLVNVDLAVNVQGAYFSFETGKKSLDVLKNATLQIPNGTIYALLGPSGCGKTTLLKIISQSLSLKTGSISLFDETVKKGKYFKGPKIGYMPQDLALIPELTVEETLYFFGGLHNVPNSVIKEEIVTLLKMLALPKKKSLVVKELSGGQKRRLSFAAALVHSPSLLVLDEPTVGVDPILRETIWKYLSDITINRKTTVLITTHYIEEAKEANLIGLMRMGKILVECNPIDLLSVMEVNNLETCFMKICAMDALKDDFSSEKNESYIGNESISNLKEALEKVKRKRLIFNSSPKKLPKKTYVEPEISSKEQGNDSVKKTSILIKRNFCILKRNPVLLLSQFLAPTLQILSFCVCVGHNLFDLPLAIVNEETPPMASLLFLDKINKETITQIPYDDLNNAIESVRTRDTKAVLHIYSNFTKCLIKKNQLGLDVDNETISCSSIKGHFDLTNKQILGTLQRSVYEAFELFQEDMLTILGASTKLAKMPLEFVQPIYGTLDMTFTEFILPAVIMTTCYFMAEALTAITFLLEQKSGMLNRMLVAGVTLKQLLISHVATQLFIVMGQVILVLLFPIIIFQIPFHGSLLLATTLSLLQGICGMSFGILISAVTTREKTALLIAMGTLYPNVFFSGYFWPLEGMPVIVRKLAYLIPLTLPTEALRAMTSRGWGIQHRVVWLGFVSTASWIFIYLIIALVLMKTRKIFR